MAQYTLNKIDDKLWREFKAECSYWGFSIRKVFLEGIELYVKNSKRRRGAKVRHDGK